MNGLDRNAELEWGRVVSLPPVERAAEFGRIARANGCTQAVDGEELLWLNDDDRVEAMFCFVDEPTQVQPFLAIYKKLQRMDCPLTFLVHPQIGRQDTYDAYRLSRKSYAEHSWELGPKGPAEPRPLHVRIRKDLYDLFRLEADEPTRAISRAEANYWAWALSTSWDETVAKLGRESARHGCQQTVDGRYILWTDEEGGFQAMFTVIADPTQPSTFTRLYEKIAATDCPLTYAFVFQPHEDSRWDVHRLCPHFSYLSHNWAFWPHAAEPDPGASQAE